MYSVQSAIDRYHKKHTQKLIIISPSVQQCMGGFSLNTGTAQFVAVYCMTKYDTLCSALHTQIQFKIKIILYSTCCVFAIKPKQNVIFDAEFIRCHRRFFRCFFSQCVVRYSILLTFLLNFCVFFFIFDLKLFWLVARFAYRMIKTEKTGSILLRSCVFLFGFV